MVLGHDLRRDRKAVRRHVALLAHATGLYDDLTIAENTRFWARAVRSTTDPAVALEGSLLPIGGPKGSALIVANELLSGALAGARYSFEISPALVMGADHHDRWACGHFLLALDPSAFGAPGDFRHRADELVTRLRGAEPAEGVDRVSLPGEREWMLSEERRRSGLPVTTGTGAEHRGVNGRRTARRSQRDDAN